MLIILSENSRLLIGLAYYLISHLPIHPCVFYFFYFLLPSFFQITSHFPSFQGEVAGDASKVMRSNMMIGRHTTMEERRILKPGSSQCCNIMGKAKCRGGEVNTCNQADRKVKESTN